MYKKILSLALAIVMLCSCAVLSASAESLGEDEALMRVLKEAYIAQWTEDYKDTYEFQSFNGELAYFGYLGEAGCHVFTAAAVPGEPVEPFDEIGDYRFTAGMCMSYCDTNPAGMYAYKDGTLMPLREAYEKGLVDLDKLYVEASDDEDFVPLSENEKLKIKCKTAYIEEYGITGEAAEYCSVPFVIKSENYTVFRVYPHIVLPMESFQYLDGYIFYEGNIIGGESNNPTGLYTLDNYGNVESLYETVNKSFIDLDEFYPTLSEVAPMYISGDIDSDGRLTVKDATLIQKYLAKVPEALETVYDHRVGYAVMEVDEPWGIEMFGGTSKVTVKDATYIQKKVAKIINEEDLQAFSYDSITVLFNKDEVREYTVEDFPEYEFEKIERWDSDVLELTILTLYLKNPGKSNVINGVNSLKYREGTDFDTVEPNCIEYND